MRRYRSPQSKQIITGIVIIAGMVIVQGRDQLYFANGDGGNDWTIGQPQAHLLNIKPWVERAESVKIL